MSAENVELIRSLQVGPDVDVAALVKDDDASERLGAVIARLFHPTVECTMRFPGMARVAYSGLEGLHDAWRDWMKHWASYRHEIEEVIDAGESVVVLHRSVARPSAGTPEITRRRATVWTVRDRRVASVHFNVPPAEALAAVRAGG